MNWLQKELETIPVPEESIKLETLKLEENKIIDIEIIITEEPFKTWKDPSDEKTIRKIIPVKHNGIDKIWWLNPANPIYREILIRLSNNETKFKIIQTGSKKNTRYNLI